MKKLTSIGIIFLFLLVLSSFEASAVLLSWNDFSNLYFETRASDGYWTTATGLFYNTSLDDIVGEAVTLTYGSATSLAHSEVTSISMNGSSISSSDYTINYSAGTITQNTYRNVSVTGEVILLTNATGGRNLTKVGAGVISVVLYNTSTNATISSTQYTLTSSTGNIILTNSSNTYNGVNVSANYTYYNTSWPVSVNYTFYNKISINCTPPNEAGNTVDSFVREIRAVELTGKKRVELWKGTSVVNPSTGTAISSNNFMQGSWYIENTTGKDVISFDRSYWNSNNLYSLKVQDGVNNATSVTFNILCKYRVR